MTGISTGARLLELRKRTIGPETGKRRRFPYMTQAEVVAATQIDRSIYNALENDRGHRAFTEEYAAQLETALGPDVWKLVSQPKSRHGRKPAAQPTYQDRLAALEAEAVPFADIRLLVQATTLLANGDTAGALQVLQEVGAGR